jgi:LacI family transcriptional regulator, galactose operon repressor
MINRNKKKHIRMDDIAAAAGVSKSAVSKALNNKPDISTKMRAHIFKICEEMGYQINFRIQDMIKKRQTGMTNNIAFIIVGIDFSDPAYAKLIDGIAKGANENNLRLLLEKLEGTEKSIYDLPPILRDGRVDGIVVSGILNVDIITTLSKLDIPYVVLGTYENAIVKNSVNVLPDIETGMFELIKTLKKIGKRKIAYFSESPGTFFEKKLFRHFKSALRLNALEFNKKLHYAGKGKLTGASQEMQEIFTHKDIPFDSIVCHNFRTAQEISHLAFAHSKEYSSVITAIATSKLFPDYKVPGQIVYYDNKLSQIAHEGITTLINILNKKSTLSSKKIIISPEISVQEL